MSPLQLAQSAVAAVSQGEPPSPQSLAQAHRDIAAALAAAPDDLDILFHAFQFRFRAGDIEGAMAICRRRIELAPPGSPHAARAHCNLGVLHHSRSELEDAERHLNRAVEIDTESGNTEGLARNLGNLALIPETRGDLDKAETLFRRAIALAEPFHTPAADQTIAALHANLGDIALRRGNHAAARDHWTQSIAIYQGLNFTKWLPDLRAKLAALDTPPSQ